jgi:predicted SAM-dependent methyltransferase
MNLCGKPFKSTSGIYCCRPVDHEGGCASDGAVRLDLGAGGRARPGFTGVDIAPLEDTICFDLTSGKRWPWKDGSVESLASSHFIEHIAADYVEVMRAGEPFRRVDQMSSYVERVQQDRLLFFFDEAYRIIKPDGLFHLTWPALKSTDAFRDPTHRRFIPLEFTHYLSAEGRAAMGLQHYEARCNWVVEGGASIHTAPRETVQDPGEGGWDLYEINCLWDVQKAFSVVLRAAK